MNRFPGGYVTNLLFNYFEGFNEGIIGREAEMRGSMVKCGERLLEGGVGGGGGYVKFLWGSPWTNCGIHVGRYLVHARLDNWIMSQDCRNTFPWHKLLN